MYKTTVAARFHKEYAAKTGKLRQSLLPMTAAASGNCRSVPASTRFAKRIFIPCLHF